MYNKKNGCQGLVHRVELTGLSCFSHSPQYGDVGVARLRDDIRTQSSQE
uniref:Uncharacterized protein n=1 Tax=Anguilla anguilla TaxID=7936 RepID=A0A0E9RDJ5_ANGAN